MNLVPAGWLPDLVLLTATLLAGALYAIGWRRLGRRSRHRAGLPVWRAWCYAAGLAALAVALLTPLDAYSSLLFTAHMVQHLLLLLIAPPLLWLGAPLVPILWAVPAQERRGAGRLFGPRSPLRLIFQVLSDARVAAVLFLGMTALWHVPALYDAAQGRTWIHDVEHLAFFGAGLLFWWPLIHPTGGTRRLGLGHGIFYLIAPMLEANAIGALLTFAGRPLYQTYVNAPRVTRLSALEDQQLGGLLMWIPGGMFWLVPLFIVLAIFLRREDEIVLREERLA